MYYLVPWYTCTDSEYETLVSKFHLSFTSNAIMSAGAATAPAVTCYTADISICSMICRVAVEEHGVPNVTHTNVDIECSMENYEPAFIAIQPKMTVPRA